MKRYWLFSIVVAALSVPLAAGKTELETLRARCAEMERQIRELEQENSKLREMNGMAAKYPVRPAPASTPAAATKAADQESPAPRPAQPAAASATAHDATTGAYKVRRGDSWERVARHHGTTPKALAAMNGATADSILHEGRTIKVPTSASGAPSASSANAGTASPAPAGRTHTVVEGDTYYRIGRKYNIPVASLEAANPTIKATALRPGLVIHLDTPATTPAAAANPSSPPPAVASASQTPEKQVAANTAPPATDPAPSSPAAAATRITEPRLTVSTPAPQSSVKGSSTVKSVPIMESITYAEFAKQHGTTVQRLNALNYLNLPETTILARGAELLVPAQP